MSDLPHPGNPPMAQTTATAAEPVHPSTPTQLRVPLPKRDRSHGGLRRTQRLLLRLTVAEAAGIAAAAEAAGLTPSGYAAEAAVAAAGHTGAPLSLPLRAALADLMDARSQLRRLATNVHVAAIAVHRDRRAPSWTAAAVADAGAAVRRVDAAAAAIARALP